MNHEVKKEETNSELTLRIIVENILEKVPVDELLGSVTTYPEGNDKNHSLRSSARVFKKIKLDANLNSTSNGIDKQAQEKKEEQKPEPTAQKEQKKLRPLWTADDRLLFFEALNEFGKDFENIHNYIVQKLKKKGVPDNQLITKENIRHLYYKTWHKISKYLKFPEGTKKIVQELYGLINYGELRKKIDVYTQKTNHKLNELIFNGCVALRIKGKMVRVKTPMCMALRRLNKLDDKDDELKLPSRVLVELRPRDMGAFLKVQNMALNPRIRAFLPLQKKLNTLINCVSKKWTAAEVEYLKNIYPLEDMENKDTPDPTLDFDFHLVTPRLKFAPLKNVKLNVPETNINEYSVKESVSFKSFQERMGFVKTMIIEKKENKKGNLKSRTESLTENIAKSPVKSEVQEAAKSIQIETEAIGDISSKINLSDSQVNFNDTVEKNDDFMDEVLNKLFPIENGTTETSSTNDNESDNLTTLNQVIKGKKEVENVDTPQIQSVSKSDEILDNNENKKNISTEEQLSKLDKIRNGWTAEDCDTITIGELYLMFGSASKITLEYYWNDEDTHSIDQTSDCNAINEVSSDNDQKVSFKQNFGYTGALRKLVSMVQLQQKKSPLKCPCGHVCSPKNAVPKKSHNKSIGDNEEKGNLEESKTESDVNGEEQKLRNVQFDEFLQPPPVHLIAQLDSIQKLKPKYSARKGRRSRTNQLVVERELPLTPKASNIHQIVRMNIISQSNSNSESTANEDHCEVDTQTSEAEMDSFVGQVLYTSENVTKVSEVTDSHVLSSSLDIPMEISHEVPSSDCGNNSNLSEFLQDSSRALSPTRILKENVNNWMASEVGDFSLSSFLGHLESPMKSHDDSHDVDAHVRSLMTENSFDYTAKFADLANKVASDS